MRNDGAMALRIWRLLHAINISVLRHADPEYHSASRRRIALLVALEACTDSSRTTASATTLSSAAPIAACQREGRDALGHGRGSLETRIALPKARQRDGEVPNPNVAQTLSRALTSLRHLFFRFSGDSAPDPTEGVMRERSLMGRVGGRVSWARRGGLTGMQAWDGSGWRGKAAGRAAPAGP